MDLPKHRDSTLSTLTVVTNNSDTTQISGNVKSDKGYGSFLDRTTDTEEDDDSPENNQAESLASNGHQDEGIPLNIAEKKKSRLLNSWLLREETSRELDVSVVSSFLGSCDETLEELVKTRRNHPKKESYHSTNRELVDTPIWNKRKLDLKKTMKTTVFDTKHPIERREEIATAFLLQGIGIIMAIVGFAVSKAADRILEKKLDYAIDQFEEGRSCGSGCVTLLVSSAIFAFLGSLPVMYRPISAGSGLAEAKAVLNGIVIPTCTSIDTAICKGLSVIMAIAAGLPAGLEGPLIHLGLCIGENINRLIPQPTTSTSNNKKRSSPLSNLLTDRSRIDFAATGCAAGVAIAFRSPISGVLFAMEEGSSFWSIKLTWRCFAAACTAVITLYFLISCQTGFAMFQIRSMALFNGIEEALLKDGRPPDVEVPTFLFWEYGAFAIVGAVGGVLGACFNEFNRKLSIWRNKMHFTWRYKIVEVVCCTVAVAALGWQLPLYFGDCVSLDMVHDTTNDIHCFRQFNCPAGEYNDLATLLLNPYSAVGLNLLFHSGVRAFSIKACMVAGVSNYLMLLVVFGTSISAGIFIPLLYIGACFGRAMAIQLGLSPTTYSVIGASAMLGGVIRTLISLTAIVVHTTYLSHFITPIMIVTLMARHFGNATFNRPGIYDIILNLRGIPFLEEEAPMGARHETIRARHIMTPTINLTSDIEVGDLVAILKYHNYDDFPVVDVRDETLVGIISRSYLLCLLSHPEVFKMTDDDDDTDDDKATTTTLTHEQLVAKKLHHLRHPASHDNVDMTTIRTAIESITISKKDERKLIHLTPYVQIAPHSFDGHGSAERAYEMVRTLGLRMLLVLDRSSKPIGMITRHELVLLEEMDLTEERFVNRRNFMGTYHHLG